MVRDSEKLCPQNSLHSSQTPHTLCTAIIYHLDDFGEELGNLVSFLYLLRLVSFLSFQSLMTCLRFQLGESCYTSDRAQFSCDSNPSVSG